MNRNQHESERIKWYKNQLSPFGQKVLQKLVEQWNSECAKFSQVPRCSSSSGPRSRQNFTQKKKVLNFRDSHAASSMEQFQDTNTSINKPAIIDIQNFPVAEKEHSNVFSSNDLINIDVEKNTGNEEFNGVTEKFNWPVERKNNIIQTSNNDVFFSNDLINIDVEKNTDTEEFNGVTKKLNWPVERKNNIIQTSNNDVFFSNDLINIDVEKNTDTEEFNGVTEKLNWPVERKNIIFQTSNNKVTRPEPFQKPYAINWNDMVDSELFQNTLPAQLVEHAIAIVPDEPLISGQATEDFLFDNDGEKLLKKKVTKRKNSTTLTEKKVKKLFADPKALRKEKYTKTVKKWLKDVDENVLDEIVDKSVTLQAEDKLKNESENGKMNISKNGTKKKVVQTKLANKDGIMKYGKAETVTVDGLNEKALVAKNDRRVKDVVKEKKHCQSKFVAPIKSQIPVKDVVYDVVTVDDSNVGEHLKGLVHTNGNTEVVAVLVYRNGFSQLNSIYTEDTCIIDGILLNINERFFFIKKIEGNLKDTVTSIFEHSTLKCYDGKMILIYLHQFIEFSPCAMIDVKIAGALLDPDNLPDSFSDVQKFLSFTPEYTIATDCALQKAAWYSTILNECASQLKALLVENSMWKIFEDVEMPLVPIIADMERHGISVDVEKLKSMEQVLVSRMKEVEQQCHVAAGKVFQINSPAQVRALLYDELRLDELSRVRVRETATTGAKSTSETALRKLMSLHPLPRLILQYRHLHKAHATFLVGIANQVSGGVVRPTWLQIASATGRVAASNPNLQAIPKKPFNLDMFAEADDHEALNFRSVYVARAGHALLAADFKHVECRVFAAAAADDKLLEALQHQDLFRALAASWLSKSEEEVTLEERERTKRIVYASLYGCGASKLMDILGVSYQQALDVLASFNRTFPSLKSFGVRVTAECMSAGGWLRTAGGRARRFPALGGAPHDERARAHRQAVNYVVQGSAADLCKVAMVSVQARLSERPGAARLLLQLHDELLWEVQHEHLHWAAGVVKATMEGSGRACGVSRRLPVAAAAGPDWANMTPV